ncbi:Vps54; component of GARP (Golgi-associated retrograde protein) complex [Paratrimastix pyriformis]|uniref:Vps54 n=1 Tax=Paratrimastix pyriformis TaxID=342808 RepID=A0ABQ8UCG9_9EUKA|nr:Vps54; component of GARP (Golgi-associated retrograde protein) complex [Paratrimastix pyriformis]
MQKEIEDDDDFAELAGIPDVFYTESFDLSNPTTFQAVVGNLPPSGIVLVEKLSHYLDLVEEKLSAIISKRSALILQALTTLASLQTELTKTIEFIKKLRELMITADRNLVTGSLKVATLRTRHLNIRALSRTVLKLIEDVRNAQPAIQLLLSTSDYIGSVFFRDGATLSQSP